MYQPGKGWEYGFNVDLAGRTPERATGSFVTENCHKNIFEPLGLMNMSMVPTAQMKKQLAHMDHRNTDGPLIARHLNSYESH